MKNSDYGYFGTGDEGYAQYMTAFERNFGRDSSEGDVQDDDFSDDSSEEDF